MTLLPGDGEECLEVDTLLGFVAGELDASQRARAEQHVDGCGECQVLLGEAAAAFSVGFDSGAFHPMVFGPGTEVAGRYRIERFVARGGMGEIYEAHDLVLDENVALKTITATAADSPKAIQRLKAEVKLSRRVGNPHTCRIFDFGEHDIDGRTALHFLTMEFIEGQALGARLRSEGRLPLDQVASLSRQLLEGLAAAHAAGVLHRDFKSDNVMLRSRSPRGLPIEAVITDFGLARALHEEGDRLTSHTQALLGSAAYMAPEQVEGEELSEATDVYAFGVVLFEMLTGGLPFRGGSPMATALLRLRRAAPKPSTLVPGLALGWDQLVLGCLDRVPNKRVSCAEGLALLHAMAGKPVLGHGRGARGLVLVPMALASCGAVLGFAVAWHSKPAAPSPIEGITQDVLPQSPLATEVPPNAEIATQTNESELSSTMSLAAANAARWHAASDAASCREAVRLYRHQLQTNSDPAAQRELAHLGICGGAAGAETTDVARRPLKLGVSKPPAPTEAVVAQPLPSDDPLEGFLEPRQAPWRASTAIDEARGVPGGQPAAAASAR